jgi:hypothetical protein
MSKVDANFGIGLLMGAVIMFIFLTVMITVVAIITPPEPLKSKKRITPDWVLETDGKKVDTVFIYYAE